MCYSAERFRCWFPTYKQPNFMGLKEKKKISVKIDYLELSYVLGRILKIYEYFFFFVLLFLLLGYCFCCFFCWP